MAAMDEARSAMGEEPHASSDDFRTAVLGGMCTMSTEGVPVFATLGSTRNEAAKDFCKRMGCGLDLRGHLLQLRGDGCGRLSQVLGPHDAILL